MAAGKSTKLSSGVEMRAARDARLAAQVDQVERAKAREMAMVANLGKFGDEYRWFVANEVWSVLGYSTFVEWWTERITPLVVDLGLRPGPEVAQLAVETIRKEQETLPPAQRLSSRAIAAKVGTSEWKVRARQDPRTRRTAAVTDLEDDSKVYDGEVVERPKSEVVEAMHQALTDAQTAADEPSTSVAGADSPDAGNAASMSGPSVLPPADGPDTPKIGIDEDVFTDRQREDAVRQLDYLERGALNVVGPVKHFSEIECSVAEEADETPHWAAEIGKTTCVECLRTVVTSDSPVEGTPITTGIDSSRAAQPSTGAHQDSVPASEESGTAPDGQAQDPDGPESAGLVASTDRPGVDPPIAVGEAPMVAIPSVAGAVPPAGAGVLSAGEAVEGGAGPASSTDQPVVLRASVEQMLECTEYMEIPRVEWDAWTPAQRRAAIDEFAGTMMQNQGGYGGGIESGAPDSDLDDDAIYTDPGADLVAEFAAFVDLLDNTHRFDAEVLGPLLTADQLKQIQGAVDDISRFAGSLETWRNK